MTNELILSVHRALIGAVPRNLKGLKVKVTNNVSYGRLFLIKSQQRMNRKC
jgi:hypothetical protein